MKNIIKSALLVVMSLTLMTACSDDNDSNPSIQTPTEFKLNTPALVNTPIDLANSSKIMLTCSQPNYGYTASVQYTVQVATDENMTDAVELSETSSSAKVAIDAASLASALTNIYVEKGKTEADFPMDVKAYFRLKANIVTSNGNVVEGTEILSNVVSLNNIHLLFSLPPVNLPSHVYTVGNFCDWKWDNCFDMVQVYGTEDTFWHLVYIDDSGIKFNTAAEWNNSEVGYAGITVSGDCKDDIIDNGGNIASKNPGWYLVIVTTSVVNREIHYDVQFNKPTIWLIGPAAGSTDYAEEAEGWSFTVPTTKDGDFVSPAFAGSVPGGDGDGVRMYVKVPGHDWWHSEFVVLSDKIEYRATGGDQARAAGSAGQKVYLNFAKGTGEIK
ncbi:SusF/SusE family outer membrane protein [Segatella copri]|uniref:SusF/SusE family outer membrane protein n=1 Tax=Segatella copri TaxID=165179 RepID=A0A6G1VP21_9BACT|nr:SusF/SusE family outer membrane protein [Segatella copri]MQN60185.1 SusF/SusE family outer membrane protein [Segatella copri]MQP15189.1 SusF/SusE family outer membrane protein [Segatella copri]